MRMFLLQIPLYARDNTYSCTRHAFVRLIKYNYNYLNIKEFDKIIPSILTFTRYCGSRNSILTNLLFVILAYAIFSNNDVYPMDDVHQHDAHVGYLEPATQSIFPSIITLRGLPGSGKSTLARALLSSFQEAGVNAAWYNQDELGGHFTAFQEALISMQKYQFILIDRVNMNEEMINVALEMRKNLMREKGTNELPRDFVISFLFDETKLEELIKRVNARKAHQTVKEPLTMESYTTIFKRFIDGYKEIDKMVDYSQAVAIRLNIEDKLEYNFRTCLRSIFTNHPLLQQHINILSDAQIINKMLSSAVNYENIIADFDEIPKLGESPRAVGRPSYLGIDITETSIVKSAMLECSQAFADKAVKTKFNSVVYSFGPSTNPVWLDKNWAYIKSLLGLSYAFEIKSIVWNEKIAIAVMTIPEVFKQFIEYTHMLYITLALAEHVDPTDVTELTKKLNQRSQNAVAVDSLGAENPMLLMPFSIDVSPQSRSEEAIQSNSSNDFSSADNGILEIDLAEPIKVQGIFHAHFSEV